MAFSRRSPAALLLLSLLFTDITRAYVLSRPATQEDQLSEALRVIQRAKRKLLDESRYQDEDPGMAYYWPEADDSDFPIDEDTAKEYLEQLFLDKATNGYDEDVDFEDDMQPVGADWSSEEESEEVKGGEEEEERGPVAEDTGEDEDAMPAATPVDSKELEEIFNGSSESSDDDVAVSPAHEVMKEMERKEDPDEDASSLSQADVAKLLNTVESTEVRVLSSSGSSTPHAKSVVKQMVIKGEPGKDGKEHMEMKGDEWIMTPEKTVHHEDHDAKDIAPEDMDSVNKEWLVEMDRPTDVSIKRKRSRASIADDLEPSDLEYVKEFIKLEDEENSNLANALNLATMSQVQRTDEYIPMEVAYLRNAITNEESIQSIKDSLGIESDPNAPRGFLEGNSLLGGDVSDASEVDDVVNPDDEFDEDEEEMIDPADVADTIEDFESERQDDINDLLATKLRAFIDKTKFSEATTNEVQPPEEEGKWYNIPIGSSEEGLTDTTYEINPFLRELIESYRRGDVQIPGIEEEIDSEGEFAPITDTDDVVEDDTPITDVCPAVLEFTDGCGAVRNMGITIDDEAMDLCNRHQLCYACGAYYGLSAEACDRGYLLEADRLCYGEEECRDEAASLYVLMQSAHQYIPPLNDGFSCANPCTLDYVTGDD